MFGPPKQLERLPAVYGLKCRGGDKLNPLRSIFFNMLPRLIFPVWSGVCISVALLHG